MAKKITHFSAEFSKKKKPTIAPKDATSWDDESKAPEKKHRKSKRSFLPKSASTTTKKSFSLAEKKKHPERKKQGVKKAYEVKLNENQSYPENENPYFQSEIKVPKKSKSTANDEANEYMPLNKYIAHCGICSRRDAVELIKKGKVSVNSKVEVNPAVKVSEADDIVYEEKRVFPQKNLVYYLLNKPKNFITTTDDPEDRNTVLDLFKGVDTTRLYPVGRLDRNTTGLLLMTNDGELAQRLSHPKYNIKKVYQVTLDKPLTKNDFDKIAEGITLEDGLAPVDEIAFVNPKDKKVIGVQIHIGRNRIVRRIFEHLQYKVTALDRVVYAGLTKKNIPRGTYRLLDEKEIIYLKHFK
ncbi:MAG TPA: pseudouridine synthase [Chitinophagaceae bacterium]|jgi:23S rRNA pseudouridine2605 synthase|nr:rRNA pseudouridine synthase [Bacteroidota bacterium]MBK9299971.1 rRNA pseudouridine synthase [Bacteroidota bacterium]MBK9480915.1 rRNA pseudouridine synthase [Bacteroidota bacterium]HMT34587.1 pseudouridine synthase [Chitinophagaceae bacterium]